MTDFPAADLAAHLYRLLTDLIDDHEVSADDVPFLDGATVTTFADEGLLTSDPGIVIHTATGHSFQIPVIQAR